MCGCKQGTCPGGCPCGCRHRAPTEAETAAVWAFAHAFASTAGDSPTCTCLGCAARRAVTATREDSPA